MRTFLPAWLAVTLLVGMPALADGPLPPDRGAPHGPARRAPPPVHAHDPGNGPRWTSNGWSFAPVLLPDPAAPVLYYPALPALEGPCCVAVDDRRGFLDPLLDWGRGR